MLESESDKKKERPSRFVESQFTPVSDASAIQLNTSTEVPDAQ